MSDMKPYSLKFLREYNSFWDGLINFLTALPSVIYISKFWWADLFFTITVVHWIEQGIPFHLWVVSVASKSIQKCEYEWIVMKMIKQDTNVVVKKNRFILNNDEKLIIACTSGSDPSNSITFHPCPPINDFQKLTYMENSFTGVLGEV